MKKHIFGKFKIVAMQLNFFLGMLYVQNTLLFIIININLVGIYTLNFYYRLLGLQISTDVMWKIDQLKFMLENSIFTNVNEKYHISHELAGEFHININSFCINNR